MSSPSSRRKRSFSESDGEVLLEALRRCREACIEASRQASPTSDVYRRAARLIESIDELADTLTGDPRHFWLKPHSSHAR